MSGKANDVTPSGPAPVSKMTALLYSAGNLGANAVYGFLNLATGLYLSHYPQVPTWAVGLLSQERSFLGAFVQPVVGRLSDRTRTRWGRRRPYLVAGTALTAAALLYLASFPPLVPMLIVLSVNAFFLNVAVDPYLALMADIVPSEQRGRVGSVLAVTNMLGQIAATVLGIWLWDRSPELVFVLVSAVMLLGFATTVLGVREPAVVPEVEPAAQTERTSVRAYVRDLLGRRTLVHYVVAAACFWLGTGGVIPYLTRFGVHVLGVSEGQSFLLFLPALLGTIVGAIPAGLLADRYGKRRVLLVGVIAFGVFAAVGSQVQTLPQALAAMAFVGLANGFWTALAIPLLIDLVPSERAAEMTGLGSALWSLAQPIGALLAGLAIDASGTYRISFIGASLFVFISAALLARLKVR